MVSASCFESNERKRSMTMGMLTPGMVIMMVLMAFAALILVPMVLSERRKRKDTIMRRIGLMPSPGVPYAPHRSQSTVMPGASYRSSANGYAGRGGGTYGY